MSIDTTLLRLLAIDPGGTTGVAIKMQGTYMTHAVTTAEELWGFFGMHYDAVIYETFAAQIISQYGLHTVRLVGGIEALCHMLHLTAYPQPPQKRKAFFQKAGIMLDDIWRVTHVPYVIHEQDALAHMLAWEWQQANTRTNEHGIVVPISSRQKRDHE